MKNKKMAKELGVSLVICLLGLWGVWYINQSIPADGRLYPRVAFLILLFLGILLAAETLWKSRKEAAAPSETEEAPAAKEKGAWFGPWGMICLAILYAAAVRYIDDAINVVLIPMAGMKLTSGLFVATPLFIAITMLYFRIRSWKKILGVTVGATILIYILFVVLLKIYLP